MRISLRCVPTVHPEAGVQRVAGRMLAATSDQHLHAFEDEDGGASAVGEHIVALVDGRRSVEDIVSSVCAAFEIDRATCERDTIEFLQSLVEKKVLVVAQRTV